MSDLVQDFSGPSGPKPPIKFRVDDDVFEAYPEIGGGVLLPTVSIDGYGDLVGRELESLTPSEEVRAASATNAQTNKALQFLQDVLLPDSAARFKERFESVEKPITIKQAVDIWRWLVAQYAGRPTQPSSSLEPGRDGTGTSSTAGASAEG